ncbi:hypothetical protein MFLAVUS_004695 [Mucor flavus]|uniref:Ribosomal RNA large subunit methyltransferase K/L-like methyltransferase domain-containing protein n=1 Tax=Mucor flavus TaxID=439312 RepID=A0ABP9YWQ3_9FUNG
MDIHILFHVPKGLEFIAVKDIEASLSHETILKNTKYSWETRTGRIHLHCTVDSLLQLKDYLVNRVQLLCIYSVTLVASESVVPADIFAEIQPTYDFIINQSKQALWSSVIDEKNDAVTFRATFTKERVKHKAPSQSMAGCAGFGFNTVSPFESWKAKMTEYQYNIIGILYQTSDSTILSRFTDHSNKDAVILLLGVELPLKDPKQRNRLYYGRTSMNPAIAYCLVKLADPKPGQLVLDMCCGTGTIPIEGASLYKDTFWLGAEIREDTLTEKAQGNLLHCNFKNMDLMLGDGRKMCYRPGVIDTIISDWPWGIRENSYSQIKAMYPKFMKQMWIALKTYGKAYIVTQGHKIMTYVLKYDWCESMWNTDEIIPIGIGGLDVYLYILSKKPNPSIVPQDIYNHVHPLSLKA